MKHGPGIERKPGETAFPAFRWEMVCRIALWSACLAGVAFQSVGKAPWAAAAVLFVLGAAAMWEPAALGRMYSPRFWIAASLFALTLGAFAVSPDSRFMGVPYSEAGLEAGFVLLCRAGVLFGTAVVISRRISHRSLVRFTRRIGFPRLGAALGLAINTTPLLADSARESAGILRIRLGRGRGVFKRAERLTTVLLIRAEQLAREAAWIDELEIVRTGNKIMESVGVTNEET